MTEPLGSTTDPSDKAVEQAFAERHGAVRMHVKATLWPLWDQATDSYSLHCSCGWRGPLSASEQAAQDYFDRHVAGGKPGHVHGFQLSGRCVCGYAAGGETGDKQ